MLTAEPIAYNVLSIDITGKLKSEHIEQAAIALENILANQERISLLVDLTGYAGMTPAAFMADLRYGLGHLSELQHYERIAVITQHAWMARLVAMENAVLRSIDMRSFAPEKRPAAEHFALGKLVDTSPGQGHIEKLATSRSDLLAMRLTGPVDSEDATAIVAILQDAFDRHGKTDLLVIMDGKFGFDPAILLSAEMWKAKRDALSYVDRYAVVGAPRFIAALAESAGGMTPVTIKTFKPDAVEEAWIWLDASPVEAAA